VLTFLCYFRVTAPSLLAFRTTLHTSTAYPCSIVLASPNSSEAVQVDAVRLGNVDENSLQGELTIVLADSYLT